MKKTLIIITALFFAIGYIGCAGIGVKWDNDKVMTALQCSAVSTVSYLIMKNNKRHIGEVVDWYDTYKEIDEFTNIQTAWKEGMEKLMGLVTDDPFLYLQLHNAIVMLDIEITGPELPVDLEKYNLIIDCFMSGVVAVPH